MTTGNNNTAVGEGALDAATTVNHNTAVGYDAGTDTTGGQNTFLGSTTGVQITSGTNNVHIGYDIGHAGNISNSIGIGRNLTLIGGEYFTFGNNSSGRVYNQFSTNASWTRSSDERKKKDINTNTDCGLDFINELRTVTYKWKAPSELPDTFIGYDADITEASYTNKMYGFIAQEVKAALDKYNITDFNGWHEDKNGEQGISYEMFIMPLVKAVQELSAKNTALETRVATLEAA